MKTHTLETYTPSKTTYKLHYKIWGETNPPENTLVCVHGLTGNSGDFKYVGEYLSTHNNIRVVAIDMAGRGQSAYFDDPLDYNFDQYLKDLDLLLKDINCTSPNSCDFLGVSMGGLLGFCIASREDSPIRRLILNDVGVEVPQADLNFIAQYITVTAEYEKIEDLVPLLKMGLGSPYSRGNMNENQWLHFAATYLRKNESGKYGRNMDEKIAVMFKKEPLGKIDLWAAWEKITQPVLALRGGLSTLFPAQVADQMKANKKGAAMDLVTLPDCGHVPSLFRDDQIEIIAHWLVPALPPTKAE
ncbi:MAG TPA: alpha/beta hydrolase [Alphaproteobacteria bacterium]|nr:alpha/beta hydrolase [Alphaproteobacteria bacterium]HRK97198.1 alpha/beta hydrolase [Alphaproteobacteria bacterium]